MLIIAAFLFKNSSYNKQIKHLNMVSNPWSILDGVLFILPIPAEIGSLLKVKTKRLRIKIIVIIWFEIFLWTVRISIDQLVAGILFRVFFWNTNLSMKKVWFSQNSNSYPKRGGTVFWWTKHGERVHAVFEHSFSNSNINVNLNTVERDRWPNSSLSNFLLNILQKFRQRGG